MELRLLESAVREAPNAVMIMTAEPAPQGPRIVFVNPAFTRQTGYSADEIEGRSAWIFEGPRTDKGVLNELRVKLMRGEPFAGAMTNYRKDGTAFDVEWQVAPVRDADNVVSHFVVIQSDVTARRRADEELREAKGMAEAADLAKSSFLAAMSHELRTPLTAIIGFSELLEDGTGGPLSERQRKYVGNILSSGRTLLDLVDQVLDITKVEVGRMVLSLTPLDLAATVADIETLVRPLVAKKNVSLAVTVTGELPKITADAPKLKQVLFELLTNGLRHTPEGGSLTVTVRHLAADGNAHPDPSISVDVHDTGPPITPEDRDRLLNHFGLLDPGHPVDSRGGGLGLALARKLVELHGGRMWIESAPGRGTLVRFTVPVNARVKNGRASEPVRREPSSGDEPLVLVIEDDPSASELLAHYLIEGGYAVARAYNRADGLAMAKSLHPAAITLDPALPDGDGLEILPDLRAHSVLWGIPVVVVSVSPPRPGAAEQGATAWIMKPVNKAELLGVLRRRPANGGVMHRTDA